MTKSSRIRDEKVKSASCSIHHACNIGMLGLLDDWTIGILDYWTIELLAAAVPRKLYRVAVDAKYLDSSSPSYHHSSFFIQSS